MLLRSKQLVNYQCLLLIRNHITLEQLNEVAWLHLQVHQELLHESLLGLIYDGELVDKYVLKPRIINRKRFLRQSILQIILHTHQHFLIFNLVFRKVVDSPQNIVCLVENALLH